MQLKSNIVNVFDVYVARSLKSQLPLIEAFLGTLPSVRSDSWHFVETTSTSRVLIRSVVGGQRLESDMSAE